MLKIDLICIGTELLQGKTLDRNLFFLGKELFKAHIHLRKCHFVRDNQTEIQEALRESLQWSDICIISGGLGPTQDDITKQTLAEHFQLTLKNDEKALQIVKKQYLEKSRSYDKTISHYHLIPEGFKALHNSVGFAPGLHYTTQKQKQIYCFPGVPSEFQVFVKNHIINKKIEGGFFQKNLIYKTWQLPEEALFKKIAPNIWDKLSNYGEVSSLPHLVGVDIGVFIKGTSKQEVIQKEDAIDETITQSPIAPYIWQKGELFINELVLKMFKERSLTIASAESCTGGLIGSLLTDIAGSSDVYRGGAVTYHSELKELLGVPHSTIEEFGVVSPEVALSMAENARQKYKASFGISTTGVAGPGGGDDKSPVGTVVVGVSSKNKSFTRTFNLTGSRETLKLKFAELALHLLRDAII